MMTDTNGTSSTSEIILRPTRRRISTSEKLRILKAVEAAAPGTQGAVLRREGIFSSQLAVWRKKLERGDLDTANLRAREQNKSEAKATARRVAELEGEVRKLRRRLERAELIGDIQKKASRLLGMDIESRESDEEN